jgi:hypothetical protein
MAYVYRHIRLDKNEPFYIGIGSDKNYKRASAINYRNKHWKNIVNKHGYEIEILVDDLSWEEACKKENEFINLYGRIDLGLGSLVNLTNGGDGVIGIVYSDERKKNISNRIKGDGNPFYGKKHNEASLLKIGEKSKGRLKSPEQIEAWKSKMNFKKSPKVREKIRQTLTGKAHTEERRKNQSKAHLGKKLSDVTKEKLRQYMLKRAPYKFTPEALLKLSESHKGIKQSPETIQKRKNTIALNKKIKLMNGKF